ncbi:hypothetical protein Tco_1164061, partial [Tanacetum coccineum]
KKGIKHCKRWYWNDPELENKWYRTQLYEMHLLLNPLQREKLENELTSREELAVLQVEFADMEGQMQQLMEELKKSQKNAFFWKSTAIVFGVVASFILLKKSAFQWLEQATLTFKELEQAMVQSPVLALPNFEEEFIIKTNASGYEESIWVRILRWEEKEKDLQNAKLTFAYRVVSNGTDILLGLKAFLKLLLLSAAGTKVTTVDNILYYLLVEKMYPLTKHKLHQMFNDVKLQVDYECKMAFELFRLVKKQLKEGYGKIIRIKSLLEVTTAELVLLVQKLLLLMLKVNAAGIKVTTAERIKTAQRKDKDCLCDILANGKGLAHIVHGKPDTGVGADVLLLSPDGCREVERMLSRHGLSSNEKEAEIGDFIEAFFEGFIMDLSDYEVPRVLVTCRSKLKFLKTVKTIISGTDREALFRQSVWDLGVKKRK